MAFSDIAFRALQDVLGEENVTNDPVVCQAYSRVQWLPSGVLQRERCGLDMRPACVVMPGSTEEVQAIIKLANRYKFPFIPRGSGFTFSAFPTQAGTIVIDPKRMNRIIELNEQDMYAVIEPYVSFVGLQAEAMKAGLTFRRRWRAPMYPVLQIIPGTAPTAIAGLRASVRRTCWGLSWCCRTVTWCAAVPWHALKQGISGMTARGLICAGFLRGGMFGHAGGMGMVTKISCKLWQWPGPAVWPTKGNANMKTSSGFSRGSVPLVHDQVSRQIS